MAEYSLRTLGCDKISVSVWHGAYYLRAGVAPSGVGELGRRWRWLTNAMSISDSPQQYSQLR